MRLLFFADGRSPIALSWISYFIAGGHEVHLASSFPCQPVDGLASLVNVPVAMSDSLGTTEQGGSSRGNLIRRVVPVEARTMIRQVMAPLTFPRAVRSLAEIIDRVQPELVHAMRIPYEGMVASLALKQMETRNVR